MPSDKKRINLTIPDEIYERLQAYKNRNWHCQRCNSLLAAHCTTVERTRK